MSEDGITKTVDLFIQRLEDLDVVISAPKAHEAEYYNRLKSPTGYAGLQSPYEEEQEIRNNLATTIDDYAKLGQYEPAAKPNLASRCHFWIRKAYANGLISEGQGLIKKLEDSKNRISELEEQLQILSVKCLTLNKEHKKFMKLAKIPFKDEWKDEK